LLALDSARLGAAQNMRLDDIVGVHGLRIDPLSNTRGRLMLRRACGSATARPTAVTTDTLLPPNWPEYFTGRDRRQKIAAISAAEPATCPYRDYA